MKYLFIISATLALVSVHAQEISLFHVDSLFYSVSVTEVENGTPRPNVLIDTVLLGELSDAIQYVNGERIKARRKYNRISAELFAENYERKDRMFISLSDYLGWDMDSITTYRLVSEMFWDTILIIVDAADIPPADLADYTPLLAPTGKIQIQATIGINNSGRYRIEAVETNGRWPITINSKTDFDIVGWLGSKTNFFAAQETDRRAVFIDRVSAADNGVKTRIVVKR